MDVPKLATSFQSADWTSEFTDKLRADAPSPLAHADCDFLVKQTRAQLEKGRLSRAKNWAALGLYLDSVNALAHFKRVGLFRASKFGFQGKPLLRLVEGVLANRGVLRLGDDACRYLESVRSLLTLSVAALRTYHFIVQQLRRREKSALKSLVATVDRMFLEPRPPKRELHSDNPGYYTIEEHAEALSFLIHTFATHRVIEDRHFNLIDERGVEEGFYERLLVAACKLRVYQEAELLVDVFSYSATRDRDAIHLRSDDIRLEQSIRLGFIHSEMQKHLSLRRYFEKDDKPVASLQDMSKQVYEALGAKMVRRLERPLPRYALLFPKADELLGPFRGDGLFKEDTIYLDAVAKEQYARPETLLAFQLADGLTVLDVVKIRRLLNFMRELMAQKLLPLMETEPQIAVRSLLPVFHKDMLLDILRQCVSEEAAQAFLRIATYNRASGPGVFDVQYQPLIIGKDYYLLPMNVLCSSDLLRNLLYTQRKKIQRNVADSPMQQLVARVLRTRFPQVVEGARIRVDGRSLEIDIAAVVERQLLLIECKSAFHPCGMHELRTSYEHLLSARKQLDRLQDALEREEVRRQFCRNLHWDPGAVEGVVTCVVTGNRLFNGYAIGDHPVRSAYELINIVVAGTVQIDDKKFHVWRNQEFEPQDLLDYLAGSTVHSDLFGAFEAATRSYALEGVTMVIWTYALDPERLAQTLRTRYKSAPENQIP